VIESVKYLLRSESLRAAPNEDGDRLRRAGS